MSLKIRWTFNWRHLRPVKNMGVDHRRGYISMTQKFLQSANIVTRLEQMGGEGMTQTMVVDLLEKYLPPLPPFSPSAATTPHGYDDVWLHLFLGQLRDHWREKHIASPTQSVHLDIFLPMHLADKRPLPPAPDLPRVSASHSAGDLAAVAPRVPEKE